MNDINTEERRNYFGKLSCEPLTKNPNNMEIIKSFVSKKANNHLEKYITDEKCAWKEDLEGETRVYLVKDDDGNVPAFFSIKCGLLVREQSKYKMTTEEREFVGYIVEAMRANDTEATRGYYDAGCALYEDRIDVLFDIARRRVDAKNDGRRTGQDANWHVEECISAIELRHLCKNEVYPIKEDIGIPLGFGVFWEVIVPKLLEIAKHVGCKYVYLFAADKSEESGDSDIKKLVRYYKSSFKFYESEDDDLIIIKPDYDTDCYGLIQEIHMLEKNREAVWHEFSDVQ